MKTPNKANQTKVNNTKKTPVRLGEVPTSEWMASKKTRPKKIMVLLTRTNDGYMIDEAVALNGRNQHKFDIVPLDVRSLKADINKKKGLHTK